MLTQNLTLGGRGVKDPPNACTGLTWRMTLFWFHMTSKGIKTFIILKSNVTDSAETGRLDRK